MSIGYNKELLVLLFANSLLQVSDSDDSKTDDDLVQKDNKDYHLNKRIDKRLKLLNESINVFSEKNISKDISLWLKKQSSSRTIKALRIVDEAKISLELLAVYILFANFGEMNNKVHDDFREFKDYDYNELADLMVKTNAEQVQMNMFNLSYDIVAVLKG